MRTRDLKFGLYADEQGLYWVRGLVEDAVGSGGSQGSRGSRGVRRARVVGESVVRTLPGSELSIADAYDFLAEQWAVEHPGESSGTRQPLELHVRLACSLRTWRAIRKTVIRTLCPEGTGPHTCRVPWSAY
ncbi:hypothetical protein OG753_14390 [Streptomyces sp. NBC_00029]|uniref:hypothetical protein n=1 Tax=Streptomyces sp. NBC_00029 TaxID=2903613 RepID=UPI003255F975